MPAGLNMDKDNQSEHKPTDGWKEQNKGRSRLAGFVWSGLAFITLVTAVIILIFRDQINLPITTEVAPTNPVDQANPTSDVMQIVLELPELVSADLGGMSILRAVSIHTDIPTRSRVDVITYTVKKGDTLFGISEKYGLKPETLLWGNLYTLRDDPHSLKPEQILNILPVNGVYHRWSEGEGLNGVAKFYGVTPEEIIDWPGNHIDLETVGDFATPNIKAGTWLVVPGGSRDFINWSAPRIPRSNPGVAKVLGPGYCGPVSGDAVGVGVFIWPANNRWLSGFDYNPGANHRGIDIDGETGDPIYAIDNGVIVYAGWNNWGYGYMIVIDHGNGWQSLYAHMNSLYVGCGYNVWQGNTIGTIGSTGNSSGSHLHFEMMYQGTKVNPWNFLP